MMARARVQQADMDIQQILLTAGIGAGTGVISGALLHWRNSGISEALFKERIEGIKEEWRIARQNTGGDMKQTITELQALVVLVTKLQASQDVTNIMTAKAIEGLLHRCEGLEHNYAERTTTESLMKELLDQLKRTGPDSK
jgi:hypothetical protein